MTIEEYKAKFYGSETDESGNIHKWTPHGSSTFNKFGILASHLSYDTQWCQEDGRVKKGKKHDFTGPEVEDGYGGCPTCTVCGVHETHWAMRGGYDE